jgi:hypothetical protein
VIWLFRVGYVEGWHCSHLGGWVGAALLGAACADPVVQRLTSIMLHGCCLLLSPCLAYNLLACCVLFCMSTLQLLVVALY